MSTFDQLEESVEDGQPVELYEVEQAGALLAAVLEASEKWAYTAHTDIATNWTLTTECAGAFDGGGSGGTLGTDLHVGVTFGCGLGAGSGFVRYTRTFGTADGLVAGTTYTISEHISINEGAGFMDWGLSINGGTGHKPANGISGLVTATGVANSAGNLILTLGFFDLEFGMTGKVILFGKIAIQGPAPAAATGTSVYFTSADTAVTYSGNTYLPSLITRERLETGGIEVNNGDLVITVPAAHRVAQLFKGGGDRPVTITMRRLHRSNLTDAVTPRVAQVLVADVRDGVCRLTCGTRALRLLNRDVPRRRYSFGCNHVVYDDLCQSLKALHTLNQAEVTGLSADGRTATVDGLTAYISASGVTDPFAGGYLSPPNGSPRRIDSSDEATGTVVLQSAIPGLAASDLVDLIEGCAHTPEACDLQHNNKNNYGGFVGIPPRDPWDDRGLV